MKAPKMKNTPSALKWLAEKRARIAGELQSAEQVSARLQEDVDALRQELETARRLLGASRLKRERLQKEVAALDQVVLIYDEGIRPELIAPINAWQGTYGKRGALRQFLVETLKSLSPAFVSTKELEILTISHFSLVFEHPSLRMDWYRGSLRGTIKVLANKGYIERIHAKEDRTAEVGAWRWKQEGAKTLAGLRENEAERSGHSTQ